MQKTGLKVAVVEDNEWFRKLLKHTLELNPDHMVQVYSTGKDLLDKVDAEIDLVTVDYRLPDMDGATLLSRLKERYPQIFVIIISEQEDIETAVELLKNGAHDYIVKSETVKKRLLHSVELIKTQLELLERIDNLESEVRTKFDYKSSILGESDAIDRVHKLIQKAIKTDINVVITGETGTGKEVVAKTIHYNSACSKGPFVAVNMAAIPSELIESELFGHEKGAFTGASNTRIGKFEQANGGTLLLDEIGELDLTLQAKILRILQEREFCKVGSNKSQKLDCRILVATNRSLELEVKEGRFREDLYYRLYGITIELPPLRSRGNDIILLAKSFIADYCKLHKLPGKKFSREAIKKLMQYDFPGNVRELRSVVELAAALAEQEEIQSDDIQFPNIPLEGKLLGMERTMREYEYLILEHYLEKFDNDVVAAARALDIGKSTVYRMLKEMEPSK